VCGHKCADNQRLREAIGDGRPQVIPKRDNSARLNNAEFTTVEGQLKAIAAPASMGLR
jgi:hypothetical protein